MSIENIQYSLIERFEAPLPEFYKRRIIFWQDEEREFESLVDDLKLDNVSIKKITGVNNFAIKKLLTVDDLCNNYLIYSPVSHKDIRDNWLLDIELYSEEFRADFISMQMEELNIQPTSAMRKTVKMYSKFLDNKERRLKLRKIGREYQTPLQLHIDIMSVLCGLNGGSAQDVLIAVLSNGFDKEENSALINIRKFGNIDAFWQLVQKYTGYIEEEGKPLEEFASHLLLTAISQTMKSNVFKGLERFISESCKAYCYSLVHDWQMSDNNHVLLSICHTVENELQLMNRFEKPEIETLLTSDVFPCINETILKRFFEEINERVIKTELIFKTVENRRTSAWYNLTSDYFDCLFYIAKMQDFYQQYTKGFHIVEPKNIWKLYVDNCYLMDSYYRHFHYAFENTLKDSNPDLEDLLKHNLEYVEGLYQNWFLKELTSSWTNAIVEDYNSIGYVSEISKQREFYNKYVEPISSKNGRIYVIISDALRYEIATELSENLSRTLKGKTTLDAMQATFPSITKFGMASLLPNKNISVTEEMAALVDGNPTDSTIKRNKVLTDRNKDSVAIQYKDLLKMKQSERHEATNGKDIVYIYHNAIDAIGDKAPTENKVFEACETAMQEIFNTVRIIVKELSGTNIIVTADHGFLYTYNPLEESQKISKSNFLGEIYEVGRRYALTDVNTSAEYLMPIALEREIDGISLKGYAPQDTIRIKMSGGGENFVHGGISLQEMVVPVIIYKHMRSASKKYVKVKNVELSLLSESRKVSNLIFSLDFYQKNPISEKVQPCTYNIYMTDEEGIPVSDRQIIIADRTGNNASERVFRTKFNLKSVTFDKNKIYRLVISNDIDVPEEIEFHIDIAFADDFGFDL